MSVDDTTQRWIASLPLWRGPLTIEHLHGGITNQNFLVSDTHVRYVVRLGNDIPTHGIMRFNELTASLAAHAAGLSPKVIHAEAGAMVLDYIEGQTLTPELVRRPANLSRIVELVKRCHHELPKLLRGPMLMFWVFHVLRSYERILQERQSKYAPKLQELMRRAATLEGQIGDVSIVFGHNDLLAANLIDDGKRIWLIDWDYAGFNSPLFDLGGLVSNSQLDDRQTRAVLDQYFGRVNGQLIRRFDAMKCASLLREAMWSMVSEIYSTVNFDYAAYTQENLTRFERAWKAFAAD